MAHVPSSPKSILLVGVSALVLAATLGGAGAFAQQARNLTHSTGNDTYADGTVGGAGLAGGRSGDFLRISGGEVTIDQSSSDGGAGDRNAAGRVEIGGVSGGSGVLKLTSDGTADVDVTIARNSHIGNLSIDMNGVTAANKKATAAFSGHLRLNGSVTLNDSPTANNGRAYLIFNGQNIPGGLFAAHSISGESTSKILAAADGEGTIKILNGREDGASRIASVSVQVGEDIRKLRELTIGDAAKGGRGVFGKEVHVDEINVISGNEEEERATVEFRANVSGDVITLDDQVEGSGDNAKTVHATAVFSARENITVGHKIVGAAAGEGRITVVGVPRKTVTFNGQVGLDGSTNKGLREINVGVNTGTGHAIFAHNSAVRAKAITITGGDQSNETSTVEFQAGLGASGDVARVILDVNRGGDAFIKFNAKNGDKNVYATIDGNSVGQGRLFVYDGDNGAPQVITFKNEIGRTDSNPDRGGNQDGKLAAIFVGDDDKFAGSAVFEEDVRAGILYVSGGDVDAEDSQVTIEKSLTANVSLKDNGGATSRLIIGGAGRAADAAGEQKVTGRITVRGHGQGTVEIRNASTATEGKKVSITGNVGANERAVGSLILADGATTISGNVFANSIDVDSGDGTTFNRFVVAPENLKLSGAATFKGHVNTAKENSGVGFQFDGVNGAATFAGTAEQRITGDISANANSRGAITVSNTSSAGVIFEGQLGSSNRKLASLGVNENAHVTFNKPVYVGGDLTVNKGVNIVLGPSLGERTGNAANQPFLTVGGYGFGNADADNKVTVALPVNFRSGTQRISSVALPTVDRAKIAFKNTALATYTLESNGTHVTANKKSLAQVASETGLTQERAIFIEPVLEAVSGKNANVRDKAIVNNAFQADNRAGSKRFVEQVVPQTVALSGATAAVVNVGGRVAGVFSDRLSALRHGVSFAGTQQTGFATGGRGLDKAFWLKPFGSWGKQSRKKTFAGFSTASYGLVVGGDAPVGDKARMGAAAAYSTSDVKGKGAGQAKTDIKSWQVSLYGDYTSDGYYLEGQLGYGRNAVSTASKVADYTRKATYDTNQFTASVGGGLPLPLGGAAFVTPTAELSWTRVGSGSYTTTGASSFNQKVSVNAIDAIIGSVGARVHTRIKQDAGILVPSVHAGMSYDFAGDQTTARGKFTNGAAFKPQTGANIEQFAGTAGVGLTYESPRWSVGANYDLDARSGYQGHTARLDAKFKF